MATLTERHQQIFEDLVKDIVCDKEMSEEIPEALARLEKIIRYNVTHSSKTCAWILPTAYKMFCQDTPTQEQLDLSFVLGWCWVILHSSMDMMDEYLDDDDTRVDGQQTWWSLNEKDAIVINDMILLEHIVYRWLQKNFENHPLYIQILKYITDISYEKFLGQSLEHQTITESDPEMTSFTIERYMAIIRYTNIGHNFFGQLSLALILAEYPKTDDLWDRVEKICENIGYMNNIQKELNGAFAHVKYSSADSGIKMGKCTWLVMQAKDKCDSDQWKKLKGAYGKNDPIEVDTVKTIYQELGLEEVGNNFVDKLKKQIKEEIENLQKEGHDKFSKILSEMGKITGCF